MEWATPCHSPLPLFILHPRIGSVARFNFVHAKKGWKTKIFCVLEVAPTAALLSKWSLAENSALGFINAKTCCPPMIPMSILDFHLILNMSSIYVPLLGFQKSAMWQMQLTVDSTATIPPVHSLMKQPLCQTPGTECKALWAPVTHDAVTRSSNSKSGDPPPRDPIAVQRCN